MAAPDRVPASRGRTALLSAGVVGVAVLLLIVLLATRQPPGDRQAKSQLVGQQAPGLGGRPILGQKVDVGAGNQWVVVNFFASWCTPCALEHPELRAFQQEHKAKGDATVVSIVAGDTADRAKQFFAKNGGDWSVLTDPEGRTALDYGLIKLPESYVVAPNGIVVAKFPGQVTRRALDDVIARASRATGTS
ncbi:MAG: dsbE [Acidimicrobiales bacterium]|nr:dsbE [Acidimicrobiales bacterium]